MPRVGFEPTIPAFERAKTVHSLDRAATVIGNSSDCLTHVVMWFDADSYSVFASCRTKHEFGSLIVLLL
jgi:hypothetical protein